MKKRSVILLTVVLLGLVVLVAGCRPTKSGAGKEEDGNLSGTVRVSGAWALYPMAIKWAEEFQAINPDVRVDISAGGAGKGAADALGGLVDIGMVSRDITPQEEARGALAVAVTRDAVVPVINGANPVVAKGLAQTGIKRSVFEDLWINERKLTWGEIAGTDDRTQVRVYTRSDACGAAESWAKYLGGREQEDLRGTGVFSDPGLTEAIAKDVNGIGYSNLNYAYDHETGLPISGLFVVPIDVNENGRVDPDEDLGTKAKAVRAIASGTYPAPPARDLYFLAKGEFKGAAKAFVEWILTDGQKYVGEVGYIELSQEQLKLELSKLEGKDE
jgi:phosphate transport system substrate-binding protein